MSTRLVTAGTRLAVAGARIVSPVGGTRIATDPDLPRDRQRVAWR